MRIDEIESRKAEIKASLRASLEAEDTSALDLDALTGEVRALDAEAEEIRANAAKEAELRNAVDPVVAKELLNKENPKMEEIRTFAVDSVEYREAWLKKLQGKALDAEERAAITASAAIPTQTMNEVIHKLERNPVIGAVDVTYIPGNVTFPVESSVAEAAWVDMGTAATDSADALTSISLAAYKLIKTVEITADVEAMAIDAFEAWLTSRLANKIEKAIDAGILNGGGSTSGECLGISKSKATQDGTFTKAGMTWKDLCAIMGALKTEYHNGASFLMSRTLFFNDVIGMEDTAHKPVVVADAQAPAKFNVLGYPVIVDDNVASNEIYFGDLKAYKFNFAKAPEIASDDSVGFRAGSRVWRAMALADGKLADANAIVRYIRAT